ncbi:MAG: IS21-like element helper ATPase IstB [Chlamydiota bacterium]
MLKETLLSLRMFGALQAIESFSRIDEKEAYITALLQAELKYREQKKADTRMKYASFPTDKEWTEIDASLNPEINFDAVKALGNGDFVQKKENICLIGRQGTGKSHSLVALGRDLCRQGISVKFYTAQSLVTDLEEAHDSHKLSKKMRALLRPKVLIIDEMGFVPFTEKGANLLFEVFSSRYEKGSIVVSTNLSFDKWVSLFKSVELTAALLDRFTHKAQVFVYRGESVRLLIAKQRMDSKGDSSP